MQISKTGVIGIYKITSPSGRVYIGQSWGIKGRWYNHGRNNHTPILFNSIKKYGKENHIFEVLQEFDSNVTQVELDSAEIKYIQLYKDLGVKLMNIKGGGSRGKMSPETIDKIRQKNIGRKIWWAHKIGRKGRKHTAEAKEKMSKSHKGKKLSSEHVAKLKLLKTRLGKTISEEAKANLSRIVKKWWIEKRIVGYNNSKLTDSDVLAIRKRIMCGETNLSKICDDFGVPIGTISQLVKNKTFKHVKLNGYEPFSKINFVKIGGDKYKGKKKPFSETSRLKLSNSLKKSTKIKRGEQSKSSKLTTKDVLKIRKLYPSLSSRKIALIYGVSHSVILDIAHFKKWKFISEQVEKEQDALV